MGAYDVGRNQYESRYYQLAASGEPEIDAEHDCEIDRHSDERSVARHQDVLPHQRGATHHLRRACEIYTSGELDDQDEEYEKKGLQLPRYKAADVRNVERGPGNKMFVSHINIPRSIPRSFPRRGGRCLPDGCLR